MATPEGKLVKAVLEYLPLIGVVAWRNNTGAVSATHKGRQRFVRFGIKGASDIFGILPGGRFLAVECKIGRNKPTNEQEAFLQMVTNQGGVAILAYSLDDIDEALRGGLVAEGTDE
jgi:hypothetical protein